VKKPIENKNPDKTKSEKTSANASPTKKKAAATGVIASQDIGPGSGAGAMAAGGEISLIDSTLIGNAAEGLPAARPKAERVGNAGATTPREAEAKPVRTGTATQPVTVKKTGFWPTALGGVVAAGLGAGAAIWALPHLPPEWQPNIPAAQPDQAAAPAPVDVDALRAEAVAAAEKAAQDRVTALREEFATVAPADGAAPVDLGAVDEKLAALTGQIEGQAAKIAELTARPVIDAEMAGKVQELAAQAEVLQQQIATAAQQAQSQITAAQAEAQKLQQAAADSTRRAEAVAAVAALQSALDRGVTPDEARSTLEAAGLSAPEALAREVPSLDSLQTGFGNAARSALRASLREDSANGGGNVITNFLRAQTGARSVEPREGNDPDAILSRADAEVEAGRIAAALDEIAALPEPAKAAPDMAEWLVGATAYRDAQSALNDLSATTN
jgi:hypothetical protein